MSENEIKEQPKAKSVLSEDFVQALMGEFVEAADKGEDVNGQRVNVEVILEVINSGRGMKVVQQSFSEIPKVVVKEEDAGGNNKES